MRKTKAQRLIEARIQRAVYGFQIPITSITKLWSTLEAAIGTGQSDADLKALVAAFPGVVKP
jgi:hypothetical protein